MDPYRNLPSPVRVCPRCGNGLVRRSLADARIDECQICRGVFVETALIARIIDALDLGGEVMTTFPRHESHSALESSSGPTYLKCPRCSGIMNRRLFARGSKVIIDLCSEHGMWFDEAELRTVAVFAAGGGMERAASLDAVDRAKRAAQRARWTPPPEPALSTDEPRTTLLLDILEFFRRW
jgi:Zn-finger nucleic acid-binding protein